MLAALLSCSAREAPPALDGTIDGYVFVTGPTAGAVVTAYALDRETGATGEALATSDPTTAEGAFHLSIGNYFGPVLLVARGVGATYAEPASGVTVAWDASTALRGLVTTWTADGALAFDVARGDAIADVVLSPFTELAVAYAAARVTSGRSATFGAALPVSVQLWWDHLRVDFWKVPPVSLTEGDAGGWNAAVQAGLALAGLSQLVRRMAEESSISPAGLTTLGLLALLQRDLTDAGAQLDGVDPGGALTLGLCPGVCALSGRTLRADFAEAMALFLGSARNTAAIGVTDAKLFLDGVACRALELFPSTAGACGYDTSAPVITVEGVASGAALSGTITATISVFDALAMGEATLTLARAGTPLDPDQPPGLYSLAATAPDAQTRQLVLTFDTALLHDGPVTLRVDATDAQGNLATQELTAFVDNDPLGHVAGVFVLGGRVVGARISAWEYDGGLQGTLVGATITDAVGAYSLELADTTAETLLLVADNVPGAAAATYLEAASGATVVLSTGDAFESVITGWADGLERADGMITPWTHLGVAFARRLSAATPGAFEDRVATAFNTLSGHLTQPGFPVDVRAVPPADLTSTDGTSTLNAQVRYGLCVAALGALAATHAAASGATPASMNTLTLTTLLARDLAEDGGVPLLDGQTGSGPLVHGAVSLDSYVTRVDLAVAAVAFLETNPNDATTFTETDVASLLDHLATDAAWPPYPTAAPPIPYDVLPPAPVGFTAPSPTEGQVARGVLALRAEATDNRALASFAWTTPGVTGALLDTSAGPPGPWVLTGAFDTTAVAEGAFTLAAVAADEAAATTSVSRTVIVDRTPPAIAIGAATTPAGVVVPPATWTGAATLTITGTIAEPHLAGATWTWNGGAPLPLAVDAGGNWMITAGAVDGSNTLVVSATDAAGSDASGSSTYYRDATPPTVAVVATGMQDESGLSAGVLGPGVGTVSYAGTTTLTIIAPGTVSFSKYASKYGPSDSNLPRWHFHATDDHGADPYPVLFVRLRDGTSVVLADWTPTSVVGGAGYNRELTLSTAFCPALALRSGLYQLDFYALDPYGNTSAVQTVSWTQTLKPPPVRQRAGAACGAADAQCPSFYGLPAGKDNAGVAVSGVGLPGAKLRVAQGYIDNPNAVPVRVKIFPTVSATWTRGHVYRTPYDPLGGWTPAGCGAGFDQLWPGGACYTPKTKVETINSGSLTLAPTFDVTVGGVPLAACAGCGSNEYELPANATATVWLLAGPYTFLQSVLATAAADLATVGVACPVGYTCDAPVTNVTGAIEHDLIDCPATGCTFGNPGGPAREVHYFTRLTVTPTATLTLQSRPASSTEALGTATGTNITSFSYAVSAWNTTETGW